MKSINNLAENRVFLGITSMKKTLNLLFCLLLSLFAAAQTCSGGLGDPIVNVNFGSGTGFGPALAPGITNMNYQNSGCVLDNAYEIVNSVSGCYTGDWVTINSDHTGNPNGYFMLIGASDQPSDFFVQTVNGLCGSTEYQFAAWVVNMASHSGEILPDITFGIELTDGTLIQSLETGGIPWYSTAMWQQFAFNFTTPPGVTTVVLRMRNNAPGGYGNDLSLDDITFRAAGPSVNVSIAGHPGDTVTLCSDPANSLQFLGTVASCYSSTAYQWQQSVDNGNSWSDISGASNTNYTTNLTTAGSYLYRLTSAQTGNIGVTTCEVSSVPDTIAILPAANPAIGIQTDSLGVCAGAPVSFTATPVDGGSAPAYQWLVNGVPASGAGGPQFSTSTLANGDRVSCQLTSNAVCPKNPYAQSNVLSMDVLPLVTPSVTITTSANNICADSVVNFTAMPVNGGLNPGYQWMVNGKAVGSDTIVFSSGALGNGDLVNVALTSSLSCAVPASSNAIAMVLFPVPTVGLTPDTIIKGGSSIQMAPRITGTIMSYQWLPGQALNNDMIADPIASPPGNITYTLTVTTADGCTASAKETVDVFYDLAMPNAFTPNGDGRNDLFRIPPGIPVTAVRFEVFNRWGTRVFAGEGNNSAWDGTFGGKAQPAGTYVWMIGYYNPLTRQMVKRSGVVELVR
jgi:gliding motility-associated-like protein